MGMCFSSSYSKGEELIRKIFKNLDVCKISYKELETILLQKTETSKNKYTNEIKNEKTSAHQIYTYLKPYLYNSHPTNNNYFYIHEVFFELIYTEFKCYNINHAIFYVYSFFDKKESTNFYMDEFINLILKIPQDYVDIDKLLEEYFIVNLVYPNKIVMNQFIDTGKKKERYLLEEMTNKIYTEENVIKYFDHIFKKDNYLISESNDKSELKDYLFKSLEGKEYILFFADLRSDFFKFYENIIRED